MSDELDTPSGLSLTVVLCVDQDSFDRFGMVLRRLTVGLVDEAIPLRVVSSDDRAEKLTLGLVQTFIHEPITWPWSERRIRRVLEMLAPHHPTIVHALSSKSYRLAGAMASAYDADLILQVTSVADCDEIVRTRDQRVGAFLTFSEPLVKMLEEQGKVPPEHIELIRPGILAVKKVACFAHADRVPTVLCTSRLERHTGVDRLIEAAAMLRDRGREVLVFLLGAGSQEDTLRRMVRDRHLAAYVTFSHPLGDLMQAFQSADVFVRPSADNAFTVDALAAMGVGAAVVSLPSVVCDHLRAEETAVICEGQTAGDLAEAIESLLADPEYARMLAARGQEYVRTHHAMSGMAQRTAEVYRKLALARATFRIKE
ncbi:MAG: glycosyltransferase family 4 protein [Planctomycetes bacterium]|nr:glycosyltransferase family 4 protein [Planctomycetota bacterium]